MTTTATRDDGAPRRADRALADSCEPVRSWE